MHFSEAISALLLVALLAPGLLFGTSARAQSTPGDSATNQISVVAKTNGISIPAEIPDARPNDAAADRQRLPSFEAVPALGQSVSLKIREAPLGEVLRRVAAEAGLRVAYLRETVSAAGKVSVDVEDTSVRAALKAALEGTNLRLVYASGNQLVVVEREALPGGGASSAEKTDNKPMQGVITGTVTDKSNGGTLPGVNIRVMGLNDGASTGVNGQYVIPGIEPGTYTLRASFVGYKTIKKKGVEVQEGDTTNVDFALSIAQKKLDEVVVVGYGTETREAMTSSVGTVQGAETADVPTTDLGNALSGKEAGLSTIQTSGKPGESTPEIYIRGVQSLGTGRSTPLFVLDGVPTRDARTITQLDPDVVESVSVLKDAAATSVYGIEGANGVIVVETKRGRADQDTKISVRSTVGAQTPITQPDMADSYTFARAYNQAQLNDGLDPSQLRFSDEAMEAFRTGSDPIIYPSTDWVDYLTKPVSLQSRTNVNVRGGTESVRYFVNGGFMWQNGFLRTLDINGGRGNNSNFRFKRLNLQSNIDIDLTPSTTISTTLGGRIGDKREGKVWGGDGAEIFTQLYRGSPFGGPGVVDGRIVETSGPYINGNTKNPLGPLYGNGYIDYTKNQLNINLSGVQDLDALTEGLEVELKGSYDAAFTRRKVRNQGTMRFLPRYRTDVDPSASGDSTVVFVTKGGSNPLGYNENFNKDRSWYMEARVGYEREFGPHAVKGLALHNRRRNFYPNQFTGIPRGVINSLGRVNYNYDRRYLLQVSLGYSGSENFAPERRFGFFPAVSGGWILTNEPFMEDVPVLDFLKLRASYGISGSDQGVGRFLYLPDQFNPNSRGYNFGYSVPQDQPGASEGRIGNRDVTWARAEKQNYGIDLRALGEKLEVSAEYFRERRSNILTTANNVPAYVAANLPAVNIGVVKNQGYELEAEWRQTVGDFSYTIGGNMGFARNEIVEQDEPPRAEPYLRRTGEPVGQPFGWVFDRFYEASDFNQTNSGDYELKEDIPEPESFDPQPGDLKYKDLNDDGVVNRDDWRDIGYPRYPEYTFGLNTNVQFKGLSMSMTWAGATNVSRQLRGAPWRVPFGGGGQLSMHSWQWENRWTPERGQDADYPRFSVDARSRRNGPASTFWLKDASYIRLKDVQLGYTLKSDQVSWLNRFGLNKARIYVSGYNLLTFSNLQSKYSLDPEQAPGSYNGPKAKHPVMKVYTLGLSLDL